MKLTFFKKPSNIGQTLKTDNKGFKVKSLQTASGVTLKTPLIKYANCQLIWEKKEAKWEKTFLGSCLGVTTSLKNKNEGS